MSTYDVFKTLLDERKIKTATVARATGITTSTFTQWKQGTIALKLDKLQKIADYFNVPLSYLTEEDANLKTPDAENILNQLIASLGSDAQINFSASEMSEDEKVLLQKGLQNALEKYTLYKSLKEEWKDDNQ